jgi:hypothetical protein
MLLLNSSGLVFDIIILVSSANNTGLAILFTDSGKAGSSKHQEPQVCFLVDFNTFGVK